MDRTISISLPVRDLALSTRFYEALGATNDSAFTDETAAMMRFSPHIVVMLLTHARYAGFTQRAIPDAHRTAQMALGISQPSRAAVDEAVIRAAAIGGTADVNPAEDHGFMYSRSVADPDGHIWEPVWMEMAAAPQDA